LSIHAHAPAGVLDSLLTMTRSLLALLVVSAAGCGGSSIDSSCDKDDGNCFARNMRLAENGAPLSTLNIGTPCNTVASLGSDVTSIDTPGTPPPAVGGALVDGFYTLTKRERFSGTTSVPLPSTTTRSETIFVSNRGSTMEFVRREGTNNGASSRGNRLLSIAGAKLSIEEKCPQPQTSSAEFSVIGKSIVLYETASVLSTFTLLPTPPNARPAISNKPLPIELKGTTPTSIELTTTSPWQCRPILCFGTLVKSNSALTAGIQSRTAACVAGAQGSTPGTVKIDVSYAVPSRSPPQALGLQIFPVSASDCATSDVLKRLANGDSGAVFGEAIVIDQTINGP
jgi:hypothetical protein